MGNNRRDRHHGLFPRAAEPRTDVEELQAKARESFLAMTREERHQLLLKQGVGKPYSNRVERSSDNADIFA